MEHLQILIIAFIPMTLCLIHQQHCEETFDASYSQGLKGMMCHNKIDLIPLKLSSIIMNLLTPFICNEFSEAPLYTQLETTDRPENQVIPLKIIWCPTPPPPPLPGEKIMTGPLDLNWRFSRGEGGGGLQILLIFFMLLFMSWDCGVYQSSKLSSYTLDGHLEVLYCHESIFSYTSLFFVFFFNPSHLCWNCNSRLSSSCFSASKFH